MRADRVRIAAGEIQPWVIEAPHGAVVLDLIAERRRHSGVEPDLAVGKIVKEAIGGPDGGFAAAGGIPGKSNPGFEIFEFLVLPRKAGEARIAGEIQSRRHIGIHAAYNVLVIAVEAKIIDRAIGGSRWKPGLPAKAVIQGQVARDLPGVLRVRSEEHT